MSASRSDSAGRRYHRHLRPSSLSVHAILVLIVLLRGSAATVTLLSESDSRSVATYPSRPAAFGNEFEWGLEYGARVQLPPGGDWWLCGDAKPPIGDGDSAGTGTTSAEASRSEVDDSDDEAVAEEEESAWEFRLRRLLAKEDTTALRKVSASAPGKGNIIVPPDGMPGE